MTTSHKAKPKAAPPRKRKPRPRRLPLDQSILSPDWFYRVGDGGKFFGYAPAALHEKILSGEIPTPIALSDSGRARGWFGRTIIAWQKEREATPAAKQIVSPPEKRWPNYKTRKAGES